MIDNIDITNYRISLVNKDGGIIKYQKSDNSISLMSPASSSIMEVTIDPSYSYYEYMTLTYVPQNNALLTLTALNKVDTHYETNSSTNVSTIAYGVRVIPTHKTSVYAFRIYVSSNVSSDCIIPVTASFYGYDSEGKLVVLESRTYQIFVTCIPQPNITVDGSEFTKLSKGSSALVEITLESNQELD